MKIKEIISLYSKSAGVQQLLSLLQLDRPKIRLNGLAGSAPAFISAGVFQNKTVNQLFILPDKEEAAYFLNDLESLYPDTQVLFFPDSYKRPYMVEETDNSNVLYRTEVLNKLSGSTKNWIVVTYPEALCEKVVTAKELQNKMETIRQGDGLSVEFMIEVLNDFGFKRVDFVAEPGDFSLRGGIIDIFSFANDDPYRIELFGNEVESIRTFDLLSQLSIKKMEFIHILPNVQESVTQEERSTFLEFIDKNSLIWLSNFTWTKDKVRKSFKKTVSAFKKDKVAS